VALISVSVALSQTSAYMVKLLYRAAACLLPAFAGIDCTEPQRDGQAELTCVAAQIGH